MKKRIFALIAAALMSLTALTACGGEEAPAEEADPSEEVVSEEEAPAEESAPVEEVVSEEVAPAEEPVADDGAPVADEDDFEG